MKNKQQIEYRNICQELIKIVDTYVAYFRRVINKIKIVNLLLN